MNPGAALRLSLLVALAAAVAVAAAAAATLVDLGAGGPPMDLDDDSGGAVRAERSTNLSHIARVGRKIVMYVSNRHLQIMPDGVVNGTDEDNSDYGEWFPSRAFLVRGVQFSSPFGRPSKHAASRARHNARNLSKPNLS